ncbi:hypothetical protein K502DRAFT_324997 [Neoconidiobolus thromboides FSU 785]|nr:hypothetical protein K502DRAFT_324997 [Neoconidiobolus thromboides FSU 785]
MGLRKANTTFKALNQVFKRSITNNANEKQAVLEELGKSKVAERSNRITISTTDLRPSPFNISLESKQRKADLLGLRNFIPGDIEKPKKVEKAELKLDEASNQLERKKLTRKILTPYYQDFHDIRNTDGKLFEAIEKEVAEKESFYMPNMELQPLSNQNVHKKSNSKVELMDMLDKKVSLVAFYLSQYGENQAQTFVHPFLNFLKSVPKENQNELQLIEINVSEQWMKGLISRLFQSKIRNQLNEERQLNYLFKYGSIEQVREKLGMVNGLIGYVFLIDKNSKIRWYANGNATSNEITTLLSLAKHLTLNPRA